MNKTITTTIAIIALGATLSTAAIAGSKEKCYGVVEAGKNDCATKT